jgi:glycosyltransferase involved in cell wall biosynthesis
MRLGIDASNLRAGGGVTHLAEILGAAEPGDHGIDRVVVWGGRATLDRLAARPWLTRSHEPALDAGLASRLFWQRFTLSRRARAACDLLHAPGGTFSGPFRPFVTMSQNLLPFQPEERRRYGASWMSMKMELLRLGQTATFRRADGIVFLNEFARDTVLAETGPLAGRLAIIPHGVNAGFLAPPRPQPPPAAFSASRPFRLLYVSTVDVYKHQWHVAEAVQSLSARGVPVALDLIGAAYAPALARLRRSMAGSGANGVVRYLGAVGHASLPARYREADAFIFASSCENMPIILLEAMASGLPIACANRGPMPAVLGDAGLYFDPESPDSIADATTQLFLDAALRETLAARAYRRAAGYSWVESAAQTLAFLAAVHSAAASSPGRAASSR